MNRTRSVVSVELMIVVAIFTILIIAALSRHHHAPARLTAPTE